MHPLVVSALIAGISTIIGAIIGGQSQRAIDAPLIEGLKTVNRELGAVGEQNKKLNAEIAQSNREREQCKKGRQEDAGQSNARLLLLRRQQWASQFENRANRRLLDAARDEIAHLQSELSEARQDAEHLQRGSRATEVAGVHQQFVADVKIVQLESQASRRDAHLQALEIENVSYAHREKVLLGTPVVATVLFFAIIALAALPLFAGIVSMVEGASVFASRFQVPHEQARGITPLTDIADQIRAIIAAGCGLAVRASGPVLAAGVAVLVAALSVSIADPEAVVEIRAWLAELLRRFAVVTAHSR